MFEETLVSSTGDKEFGTGKNEITLPLKAWQVKADFIRKLNRTGKISCPTTRRSRRIISWFLHLSTKCILAGKVQRIEDITEAMGSRAKTHATEKWNSSSVEAITNLTEEKPQSNFCVKIRCDCGDYRVHGEYSKEVRNEAS